MEKLIIHSKTKVWEADVPQFWDEVPENIYPNLAQLFLKELPRMTESDKLVRALYILAWDAREGIDKFDLPHLEEALTLIAWVFSDLKITKNLLPSFEHEGVRYLGPEPELGNLRFGEFVMAEAYFIQYWEQKDKKALDKLIAVLYRPAGAGDDHTVGHVNYCGDVREKFNGNLTEHRAGLFANLDLAIKDGIYLYYLASRWQAFDNYPYVFPKRAKQKIDTPRQKVPKFGWLGVFDDLLGEKGRTAESLEMEFVHTTLMSLERGQIKFKDLKKK